MSKSLQLLGCLALIAMPLIAVPAQAASSSDTTTQDNGQPHKKHHHHKAEKKNWDEGKEVKWEEKHEPYDDVRAQREAIDFERDRVKMRCMDTYGRFRSACLAKMADLDQREAALRNEAAYEQPPMHEERHEEKKKMGKKKHHPKNSSMNTTSAPHGGKPVHPMPADSSNDQ